MYVSVAYGLATWLGTRFGISFLSVGVRRTKPNQSDDESI